MNTADSGPVTQTKNLMKDSIVKTKIHTVIPIKKTLTQIIPAILIILHT